MTRPLAPAVLHAVGASVARLVWLVRLDYPSGVVTACSAPFPLVWGGETYFGVGSLGSVGAADEGAELQSYSLQITLAGVKPEYVAAALGEAYQGRDARVYVAMLDADHAVIGDPVLVFRGRMDTQDIELGTEATITVTIVSRLVDWDRPRISRYTNEDQQSRFPGDRAFEFVNSLVDATIYWGRS